MAASQPGGRVPRGDLLQRRQFALVLRRTEMLDLPRTRREDHTTCTAVAREVVRTVLTYATAAGFWHRLALQPSGVAASTRQSLSADRSMSQAHR